MKDMVVGSQSEIDEILPKHDLVTLREMLKVSPIRADYPRTSTSVL